jgi:2-succinyl-6-hydroxy-2,4-cyclohexadiene-1-carboxylate synthase
LKINLSNVSLNIEEFRRTSSDNGCIIFLHGFTGCAKDWEEIIALLKTNLNLIAVDLIGHGQSDSPTDVSYYTAGSIADQIHEILLHLVYKPIILAGYSMGGRTALSFAVKYPSMINGLILESTGAGIIDENLRIERTAGDEKLAEFIETHSMEEFVDNWMNLSLFDSQKNLPEEKQEQIRKQKLNNSKTGLANSLRGFSSGKMPPLFDNIKKLSLPTLLISGELDQKYTGINNELENIFPSASHIIVKNAGHNVHLEQPSFFIDVINDFLNRF